MIESLLKELGERHFEILWRYESATNSIVIQMDKRDRHQRHGLVRKVMFDDFHRIRSNQFEQFELSCYELKKLKGERNNDIYSISNFI